jgi:DNA modification methylase
MAVIDQIVSDTHALYNGDCCEVMPKLPSESVGHVIYSPPFCGLFHYSSSEHDLSNCRTYAEFFEHYEFVVSETFRLLKPGRIAAVHCMDVPKDGANIAGYKDFPGDIIRLHEKIGFEYTPRICVWKEPLGVRNRTMAKALTHRQIVEDSTLVNVAAADYLIPFRKKGENPEPVTHERGLMSYAGKQEVPADLRHLRGFGGLQTQNRFSHWIWRQYASCFWHDVRLNRVLPYHEARDQEDERHLHPLQLDVIERSITLWSNPGDVVLTPFMGVGSEAYMAVAMGRKALGIELKPSYYRQALKNIAVAGKADEREEELFVPPAVEDDTLDTDEDDA